MTQATEIYTFGAEDLPTCPTCGVRMVQSDVPASHDDDGPIWVAWCETHGEILVQFFDDEEEDDGSD